MIKFQINSSDAVYYTKPIKISHKESVRTYRFDYTSNRNMEGISYVSAVAYQSIRLALKFTGYSNNSEVGEYYQISTGNNISTRFLRKMGENFIAQNIDIFTFERLQEVFMHDIIYIDGKRLTNKPILEPQEQIGNTDLIKANFTAYLNENDTYEYEFQVFDGLVLSNYNPFGLYITGYQIDALSVDTNINIELLTGSLRVYDSSDTLIYDFNESDMVINSDTQLKIISTGTPVQNLPNGTFIYMSTPFEVHIERITYFLFLKETLYLTNLYRHSPKHHPTITPPRHLHIVRNHHHRPRLRQPPQQPNHHLHHLRVQRRRRFIKQKDALGRGRG